MSSCKEKARELLPEFVLGALDAEEMVRVADHLENCSECTSEIQVLRQLVNEPLHEPPPWFWTTLPGKVTGEVQSRRKRKIRFLVPVWAGGLATAAIALLLFLQPGTAPQQPGDENGIVLIEYSGASFLGLEEEILSVSGAVLSDLEKPLVMELEAVSEEYIAAMDLIMEGDGYEMMDEITLQVFEDILEKMTPERVRKRVTS